MSAAPLRLVLRANVVPIHLALAIATAGLPVRVAIRFKPWQVWTFMSGAAGFIVVLLLIVRAVAS